MLDAVWVDIGHREMLQCINGRVVVPLFMLWLNLHATYTRNIACFYYRTRGNCWIVLVIWHINIITRLENFQVVSEILVIVTLSSLEL